MYLRTKGSIVSYPCDTRYNCHSWTSHKPKRDLQTIFSYRLPGGGRKLGPLSTVIISIEPHGRTWHCCWMEITQTTHWSYLQAGWFVGRSGRPCRSKIFKSFSLYLTLFLFLFWTKRITVNFHLSTLRPIVSLGSLRLLRNFYPWKFWKWFEYQNMVWFHTCILYKPWTINKSSSIFWSGYALPGHLSFLYLSFFSDKNLTQNVSFLHTMHSIYITNVYILHTLRSYGVGGYGERGNKCEINGRIY